MRRIKEIIIHCTATKEGEDVTVASIDAYHRSKGWNGIGYHYVIYRDGSVHKGRDLVKIGAHCQGHNSISVGVCYVGGLDSEGNPKDTRTAEQKASLAQLISELRQRFPNATVHGHREFANKACPCFNVKEEF